MFLENYGILKGRPIAQRLGPELLPNIKGIWSMTTTTTASLSM